MFTLDEHQILVHIRSHNLTKSIVIEITTLKKYLDFFCGIHLNYQQSFEIENKSLLWDRFRSSDLIYIIELVVKYISPP